MGKLVLKGNIIIMCWIYNTKSMQLLIIQRSLQSRAICMGHSKKTIKEVQSLIIENQLKFHSRKRLWTKHWTLEFMIVSKSRKFSSIRLVKMLSTTHLLALLNHPSVANLTSLNQPRTGHKCKPCWVMGLMIINTKTSILIPLWLYIKSHLLWSLMIQDPIPTLPLKEINRTVIRDWLQLQKQSIT
jgi:hypothetical protein